MVNQNKANHDPGKWKASSANMDALRQTTRVWNRSEYFWCESTNDIFRNVDDKIGEIFSAPDLLAGKYSDLANEYSTFWREVSFFQPDISTGRANGSIERAEKSATLSLSDPDYEYSVKAILRNNDLWFAAQRKKSRREMAELRRHWKISSAELFEYRGNYLDHSLENNLSMEKNSFATKKMMLEQKYRSDGQVVMHKFRSEQSNLTLKMYSELSTLRADLDLKRISMPEWHTRFSVIGENFVQANAILEKKFETLNADNARKFQKSMRNLEDAHADSVRKIHALFQSDVEANKKKKAIHIDTANLNYSYSTTKADVLYDRIISDPAPHSKEEIRERMLPIGTQMRKMIRDGNMETEWFDWLSIEKIDIFLASSIHSKTVNAMRSLYSENYAFDPELAECYVELFDKKFQEGNGYFRILSIVPIDEDVTRPRHEDHLAGFFRITPHPTETDPNGVYLGAVNFANTYQSFSLLHFLLEIELEELFARGVREVHGEALAGSPAERMWKKMFGIADTGEPEKSFTYGNGKTLSVRHLVLTKEAFEARQKKAES